LQVRLQGGGGVEPLFFPKKIAEKGKGIGKKKRRKKRFY